MKFEHAPTVLTHVLDWAQANPVLVLPALAVGFYLLCGWAAENLL